MKQVQDAIAPTGIACFAGVWRPTTESPHEPATYVAYTCNTHETEHYDDRCTKYYVNVYLNLYSRSDPTPVIRSVVNAMRAAGFDMSSVEETETADANGQYRTPMTFGISIEEEEAWASIPTPSSN